MYIVPQYKPKIRLISQNGDETVFENYKEFLEKNSTYFIREHVVTTFKDWPVGRRGRTYYDLVNKRDLDLYIVRDEFGSVFSPVEIIRERDKEYWERINIKYLGIKYNHHIYRTNPVPSTGKHRWHFRHFYKRPRTTQEKRWALAHKEYVRGKRRKHYLPDAWEDLPRSDSSIQRSWKKCKKKKQWM